MAGPFKLQSHPHGEDPETMAGGDSDDLIRPRGRPILPGGSFREPVGAPPGEGSGGYGTPTQNDEIENLAAKAGLPEAPPEAEPAYDFLALVTEAENQAAQYMAQVNHKGWAQSMRAMHNEHFAGSKYTTPDWRNRSKIFRPKTRSAIRKDMAAVQASMFNAIDAINCMPGNEADPRQRGAAAVMEQLVNYRTDGSRGRASMPWFQTVMGARQNALLTGICLSKQSWKLELRKSTETVTEPDPVTGAQKTITRDVYYKEIDRPNVDLIPPENFLIDPAADWTDPAQSAAYIIIKWPMQIDEIRQKQKGPISPWNEVDEGILLAATQETSSTPAAIRSARESGNDRYEKVKSGSTAFKIVWVYEVFMLVGGEDHTFLSVGNRAYLTDPKPTREVYPEQFGERPLALGYGSLEAHRIFPMSPVESWQMMQIEVNDLINLSLDAIKQNVMPVSKVRRGRQIDLDQVKRRASGSSIMVSQPDDVTWERVPDIPQSVPMFMRDIELEMDDLAGQFNGQSAEHNNALSRTLGGLKLVAGSANAVQEMDIRVWIETWVSPTLSQVVRLEQYYEHDPIVLGLCGERAELMQKYGINKIDDELMEQEVTIRVNVGLGAGDPQQRLARFQSAASVALPLLQSAPEFTTGELAIDVEAVLEEVFGAAGYRDGGMRFIKKGKPQQDPLGDLKAREIQSKISKNDRSGRASLMSALAAVAKVALGNRELEAAQSDQLLDRHLQAQDQGHGHAMDHLAHRQQVKEADRSHTLAERGQDSNETDMGHRHGMEVVGHKSEEKHRTADRELQKATAAAKPGSDGAKPGTGGGTASPPSAPPLPPEPDTAASPPQPSAPAPQPVRYDFIRDPKTKLIVSAVPVYPGQDQPPAGGSPPDDFQLPPGAM